MQHCLLRPLHHLKSTGVKKLRLRGIECLTSGILDRWLPELKEDLAHRFVLEQDAGFMLEQSNLFVPDSDQQTVTIQSQHLELGGSHAL